MVYLQTIEIGVDKEIFLVSFTHPKGGNIVWACVEDNIVKEKDQHKYIEPHGFGYKLFE